VSQDLGKYDAQAMETRLYDWWVKEEFFKAGADQSKKPYTIVMPPPNVTGVLHLGHALDNTVQDLLIRFKRMQGFDALWVPGTDHAGIATQTRVEAKLMEESKTTRHDLGREKFIERVWSWKEEYAGVIRAQIRRLGASVDWSRERFTMDPGLSDAVREVFVRLYEDGLIYRGDYIINWCPRCGTALSDIEVEYEEKQSVLYEIDYPFVSGEGSLTVATTRPETLFGDVAVAVHPEDARYAHLVGNKLRLPFVDREIPVIADEYVDPEFGTGAVKITPAHDPNDFEVGKRHHLPAINVMTKDGTLSELAGEFAGMERFAARTAVIQALRARGQLREKAHVHSVGHCERCKTVVEPWLSTQWFVKMQPLAVPAMQAVQDGVTRFVPSRFEKIYQHWLENIRDWCISRQLWWGHRIPAWYCADCGHTTVARTTPEACGSCGSTHLHQDEDVLDTWFSSALWPFSTMGWPHDSEDLMRYFPTNVLSTGFDIIYFWVARMIFSSLYFTKQVPFQDVLIHGLVRDGEGRKFSKSLGNGIDPMDVIAQYSADALRFMLVTGAAMGQDMRFYMERVEAAQSLVTKIWNAAKFVIMNTADMQESADLTVTPTSLADRYILHRLQAAITRVTEEIEAYQFAEAGKELYEFFWNDFCDWYIELAKVSLYAEDEQAKLPTKATLIYVLDAALRLLHPYMPFVTEEIWQHLPHSGRTITLSAWPVANPAFQDYAGFEQMALVMDTIRAVRNLRHEANVAPSKKVQVVLKPNSSHESLLNGAIPYILRLCNAESVIVSATATPPEERVTNVIAGVEVYLSLAGLVEMEAELERLRKEKKELDTEVSRLLGKLNNAAFVAKAPADIVEKEKEKLAMYEDRRDKVVTELARWQK
jgi:valyl-tRNA synthetase